MKYVHFFKKKQKSDTIIESSLYIFLVYNSSYVCVTQNEHVSLHDWLAAAEKFQDARRIHKWRSFYIKTLHPLDAEAVALIKNNAHLFHNVRYNIKIYSIVLIFLRRTYAVGGPSLKACR